tara:strand:+ start:186 stop:1613 length:1428 start_codon:yes stop_codon:yes gene_type:complete
MYDPKFSQKQMYDQYGSSRKTTTNANKQFAETMKSSGGGRNMSGIGAKPSSFGGGQDNNPNRDESENKSTIAKVYEKTVDLLKSFGAEEPKDVIVDGKRVYQGPAFRGFTPTVPTENFGGEYGKKRYLLGIPQLGETIRSPVSPTLPPSDKNPTLNMFGVRRGFTRDPNPVMSPPSTDVPANMDPLTRGLSQAMLPVPDVPTAKYKIQLGDTLSEIADATGTTVEELARINNIKEVDVIKAGADIDIPIKRIQDEAVVTQANSMEDLKPIKASFVAVDRADPDRQYYESFREGVTPIQMLQTTGDDTYVSADYMSELEILARTIEAEAGGESKKGKLAVGAVIKNRADQNRFGTDIRSVILFPSQFSPWNKYTGSQGGKQGKDMLGEKMKPSKDSYDAAKKILSGNYVDPTFGASHFVNPKISKPSWYKGFKENGTTKIGKHEFGDADNVLFTDNVPPPLTSLRPKVRPKGLGAK